MAVSYIAHSLIKVISFFQSVLAAEFKEKINASLAHLTKNNGAVVDDDVRRFCLRFDACQFYFKYLPILIRDTSLLFRTNHQDLVDYFEI